MTGQRPPFPEFFLETPGHATRLVIVNPAQRDRCYHLDIHPVAPQPRRRIACIDRFGWTMTYTADGLVPSFMAQWGCETLQDLPGLFLETPDDRTLLTVIGPEARRQVNIHPLMPLERGYVAHLLGNPWLLDETPSGLWPVQPPSLGQRVVTAFATRFGWPRGKGLP